MTDLLVKWTSQKKNHEAQAGSNHTVRAHSKG